MNWIEKMIAEQCPNGVERVKFQDFATYTRGVTYNKSQESFSEDDSYKILRANNITLERNAINFDDIKFVNKSVKIKEQQWLKQNDILICAGSGSKEHVGKVAFIDQNINYSFGGFMAVIRVFDGVNSRYLFHNLTSISFHDYLTSALNSTTINNLNIQVMSGFEIPLPSLSIQKEIVSVLDKFSELIEKTDEEIALRQKQYEYYREKLLTFEDGEVEWKTLASVFDTRNGYTPSTKNIDFWNNGDIPWFKMEDIRDNGRILSDSKLHITSKAVKGKGLFKANTIILATSATIGEHALVTVDYLSNQRFTNLSVKKELAEKVDIKFYYFYMYIIDNWCKEHINQGGFASVDMGALYKLLIPVPSLSRQQEIVATLDKFEALISKLKEERELRQKQYEYYREKLLTF